MTSCLHLLSGGMISHGDARLEVSHHLVLLIAISVVSELTDSQKSMGSRITPAWSLRGIAAVPCAYARKVFSESHRLNMLSCASTFRRSGILV